MEAEQDQSSTASPLYARIGTTLENRYRILDVLAEGGMGVVYRGERIGLSRPVAVKFLHASFAADMKVRERFERELQAMSRLTHPNCISVVDYGIADSPFIVMEYVTGPTLRQLLAEHGRLPTVRALFIASQILAALAHAHAQDMIHRDIKPGNIILSDIEGTLDHVYVLDFGLAKFLSGAASDDLTASGMLLGTPSYMSPEQARAQAIGAATDIYATGVVLFELLTGSKPYSGQHALDILHMHQFAPVPSIRERAPECRFSKALDEAIQTALAKDPAQRFPTATAFSRALDLVPEAAAIRTSTKLRALTPPPGLDLSEPADAAPAAAAFPVMDLLETIGGAPADAAAVPGQVSGNFAAVPAVGELAALASPLPSRSGPDTPSITSASTLSTLVPGALQPRATAPAAAVPARGEDTPLAIAVGPLGRLGAGTTRIALIGAALLIAGLVTWYTVRDGSLAADEVEGARIARSALAVAGPVAPASDQPSEPGVAAPAPAAGEPAGAEPSAAAEVGAGDELAIELEGAEAADVEAEVAEVAEAVEAEAADAEADEAEAEVAEPEPEPELVAKAGRVRSPRAVDDISDIERLLQQGRRDEAIKGILRLRRTNFPRSAYLAWRLGNLYFEKQQWSNGLAAYDDALRLKPGYRGNATLNNNVIRALAAKQTWRKASTLYLKRIRKGGVRYLRDAAQSDRNSLVRQRAKQLLGRINKR